jgi:hypothetical protein
MLLEEARCCWFSHSRRPIYLGFVANLSSSLKNWPLGLITSCIMKRHKSRLYLEVVSHGVGPGVVLDESAINESREKLSKC